MIDEVISVDMQIKNRELLLRSEVLELPILLTRKLADCSVSVSAFLWSIMSKFSRFRTRQRKAKTL